MATITPIRKPKIHSDEHRLVISHPQPGKADHQDIYCDRRIGLSWPSANSPGYYCVVGLHEDKETDGNRIVRVLMEGERKQLPQLFDRISAMALLYHANWILAHVPGNDNDYLDLGQYRKKRGVKDWTLIDTSEFSGLEEGRARIAALIDKRQLKMPLTMKLQGEISRMRPHDLLPRDKVKPEERMFRTYALCHVITSYQMYPFRKPIKAKTEIRRSGYGG